LPPLSNQLDSQKSLSVLLIFFFHFDTIIGIFPLPLPIINIYEIENLLGQVTLL
jgi:hypothetical protein